MIALLLTLAVAAASFALGACYEYARTGGSYDLAHDLSRAEMKVRAAELEATLARRRKP